MIIRHKHKGRFTVVPNAIYNDDRISLGAKGLLGYLLSRPGNWDVRHDQLQHKLAIGRKMLCKLLRELEAAGYLERDEEQGRDGYNRFTTLNYVVRDIPEQCAVADTPAAPHPEPMRDRSLGNNKEEIKTQSNKPFPKPPSSVHGEAQRAYQGQYSQIGQAALAAGMHPVFVGSKPFDEWRDFRGSDGMPPTDQAVVGGRLRAIVWLPSLYPPKHKTKDSG
jgi:hypothetical protein